MNILTIDAEFNQPSGKTIQIGGAVYKARTGEFLESVLIFVNPKEPISPYITDLTGITDKDVEGGMSISEAYFVLKDLHKKHKCFRNPIVWGSGVRNDSSLIHQEAMAELEADKREDNFMGFRVVDAKTLFQSMRIYQNKEIGGGLAKSMRSLGLKFEGVEHTALDDAKNTFRIWHHMTMILGK